MSAPTPIAVAWSGGKDSAWMLHVLRGDPRWDVVALLTSVDERDGSVAVHRLPRAVLNAQAAAVGLPVIDMELPAAPSNAVYVARFSAALGVLRSRVPGLSHLAFGDLFLADVRGWREALCASLGWTPLFPLWHLDTAELARRMIDGGLRATLCCVDTTQMSAGFAGRAFDASLLAALPDSVDPCGERGEFHTCAFDGPMFSVALKLTPGTPTPGDERFIYCVPEPLR